MDNRGVSQQIFAAADIGVVKEPRGFIRIVEMLLAIFAFATTAGFSSHFTCQIQCNETAPAPDKIRTDYSYPFVLEYTEVDVCGEKLTLVGNFAPPSEYFVAVGVLAFLYSIAALVLYVFFERQYRSNSWVTVVDFGVTAILTFMWLTSSASWAKGLSDLKYYSNPTVFLERSAVCKTLKVCEAFSKGSFAGLNVSVTFGFLNLFVWSGNLWFLIKETPWFQMRQQAQQQQMGGVGGQPGAGGDPRGGMTSIHHDSSKMAY